MSCAFCNPDVLACQEFFTAESVRALIDYHPISEGHSLIIPKRHVGCFEDLTDNEWKEIREVILRVHRAASSVFGEADYLLLQKNGKGVGQTVPHVHFHYVRQSGWTQTFWFLRFFFSWMIPAMSAEAQAALRDQLAQACAGSQSL